MIKIIYVCVCIHLYLHTKNIHMVPHESSNQGSQANTKKWENYICINWIFSMLKTSIFHSKRQCHPTTLGDVTQSSSVEGNQRRLGSQGSEYPVWTSTDESELVALCQDVMIYC